MDAGEKEAEIDVHDSAPDVLAAPVAAAVIGSDSPICLSTCRGEAVGV